MDLTDRFYKARAEADKEEAWHHLEYRRIL